MLHSASTQYQGCTLWDYKGVVTANITNIVVDCGHNDWTWIDGTKTAGIAVPPTPQYGSFPQSVPTTIPNPFTNTPGARYSAAGWTDKFGNLFLFGGDGWELAGSTQADTLDAPMNDLWVCIMSGDYCQWQLVGGYDPTAVTVPSGATYNWCANHRQRAARRPKWILSRYPSGSSGSPWDGYLDRQHRKLVALRWKNYRCAISE